MTKPTSKRGHSNKGKTNKQFNSRTAFKNPFPSEAILQQAIAGLLTRMPDITGVQILQGQQELGKDLIFNIPGGFGEQILCACVVKNSKITGVAGSSGGARTVYQQSEQAFDSEYTDNFGKNVRIERVYIVTPYDLPPETILSIKGKLKERTGQIVFIGGTILFDLFKKYWSDYFADEAEIIEQHLIQTRNLYETENPLEALANQYYLGDVSNYSKKIYVSQTLYRNINEYALSPILTRPIPVLHNIEKNRNKNAYSHAKDKLNELRVFITYLNKWNYCEESAKVAIYNSCDLVTRALSHLQEKTETHNEQHELKEIFSESNLTKRIAAINKFEIEKKGLSNIVAEQTKALYQQRDAATALITEHINNLKVTLFPKNFNPIDLLSDPVFLQALILDDCAKASPENMFVFKKGVKLSFPKDILNSWQGHLLIVGAPGYGKTSFCRWHALQDAENFNSGKSNTLPVYIPLSRLSNKSLGTFEDTFLNYLGKSALLDNIGNKSRIKVRLYLDGLDEIASQEKRREIIDLIKCGVEGKEKYQIILTARDYIYARWLDWLPRISLGGFDINDIEDFIDGWLGHNSENNKLFRKQMNETSTLNNLMQTPLLATLIIMVFRQTGKLPESKTRLYEIFINLLSGGWDLAKKILRESKFGERIKVQVLGTLASTLQEKRRREFYIKDLTVAMSATLSGAILQESELLQEELISDGLITKSGELLQFSHHSFQEFLTARDLMSSPQPTRINHILEVYLAGDDWWKEVLAFYISLSSNPTEVIAWLDKQIRYSRSLGYTTVSSSQLQTLRTAFREAFPDYSIVVGNPFMS